MESRAHSALIGVFVLLAVAMIIGFIAWFSKAEFDQQYELYEVSFPGPVRGVNAGTEVRFNGLRLGEVTKLRLDPKATNTVLVDLRITAGYPVTTDSYAQLEPSGLTGLNYIQIFQGESGVLMTESEFTSPYSLPGRMSQIETFLDDGGSVIQGAQRAIARVNAVLTPDAIQDFHDILENINVLSKNLSETDIDTELVNEVLLSFKTAADDVSEAALAVDKAADDFDILVQDDVKVFLDRAIVSMTEVDETLNAFESFAGEGSQVAINMSDAINRLSNSGLTDLEETADMLRRLVESLNRVVDEIEQNPAQFIAGKEIEAVELPQ
jgi:phospholipid/cholesterol/gamma-HCH transport system substrate-binding protein